MKYLGIHKLIWVLLVILYVILEVIIIYGIFYIIYVLWNFKFSDHNLWRRFHAYREYGIDEKGDLDKLEIEDNNPWDTIKRRYNIFFEE